MSNITVVPTTPATVASPIDPLLMLPDYVQAGIKRHNDSKQVVGVFCGSYKEAQGIVYKQSNEMLGWHEEMSHALAIRVAVDFSQAMKACGKTIQLGKAKKKTNTMPLKELSKAAMVVSYPLTTAYLLQECDDLRSQGATNLQFEVSNDIFEAIKVTALKFFPELVTKF